MRAQRRAAAETWNQMVPWLGTPLSHDSSTPRPAVVLVRKVTQNARTGTKALGDIPGIGKRLDFWFRGQRVVAGNWYFVDAHVQRADGTMHAPGDTIRVHHIWATCPRQAKRWAKKLHRRAARQPNAAE